MMLFIHTELVITESFPLSFLETISLVFFSGEMSPYPHSFIVESGMTQGLCKQPNTQWTTARLKINLAWIPWYL